MAEGCVDHAATLAQLPDRPCVTRNLKIHGATDSVTDLDALWVYGSDAAKIQKLIEAEPGLAEKLHPALPYLKAEVIWSVRQEMARTVEDVLARRTRALFLNARAGLEMCETVADLMAKELAWSEAAKTAQVASFRKTAANYLLTTTAA
jgi:glycerol-3-phosphate dehydrogenase